jgi:hypothetical protein
MPSLFDLTGDALAIQRQIDSAAEQLFSDDPAAVALATTTLESLISAEADNRRAVEVKADAWCWVIDHMRAQAATRAAHAQRLKDLAAAAEQQADALQDRLVAALQRVDPDATRWELQDHKLISRVSTAVEVEVDATELPEAFQRVKTTYSADKTALKSALQRGEQIDGVALVERRSWKIA